MPLLEDQLHLAGLRVTRQRVALFGALTRIGRHATAEEVQREALADVPGLTLPTVYAGLDLFASMGLARRVVAGADAVRWDPRTDTHVHFSCSACGAVLDVDASVSTGEAEHAAIAAGLQVDCADVVLRGTCAACR